MVVTYCTAEDVQVLLQIEPFTVSTTPTLLQVESIINKKEDRIDQKLEHGWREKTSSLMFVDTSFLDFRNGYRYDLPNYSVRTLTNGTDTLEVWDGSQYVDYLADKTEGRDEDYWVDYDKGVLYIKQMAGRQRKKPIRIQFRYGETVVPGEIEDLCIYMACKDILAMYQQALRFVDDGNSNTLTKQQRVDYFNEEIKDLFIQLSNIGTL